MNYEIDSVFRKLQECTLPEYKTNAKIVIRDIFIPDYSECKNMDERVELNTYSRNMRNKYSELIDNATSFNEVDQIKRAAIYVV